MTGSRAPTIDHAHTPYAEQARERKAVDLEHFAYERGYRSADLTRDEVRDELLGDLARHRGKPRSQVSASLDTWRAVWRLLRDREQLAGAALARVPGGGS